MEYKRSMILNDLYAWLGIASFVLTWVAVFYVLYNNPRELSKSISHHAAKNSRVYFMFATLVSVGLIAMFGFLFMWLVPNLNIIPPLILLFIIALLLEFVTTWVPLTEGKKFHIHNILSYSTALLMPLIVLALILTIQLSAAAFLLACIALVIMLALLLAFFAIPKALEKYLIYQSTYIAAFQLAIIWIPFL